MSVADDMRSLIIDVRRREKSVAVSDVSESFSESLALDALDKIETLARAIIELAENQP